MLNRSSIEGTRKKFTCRLENERLWGKRLREPREKVTFSLRPSTIELNYWLAGLGWAPGGQPNNVGRAIDFYTRRYWWQKVTPRKWPDNRRSTKSILDELVEILKTGEAEYLLDLDLIAHPNRSRMIDFLASFWYIYEGGVRLTY